MHSLKLIAAVSGLVFLTGASLVGINSVPATPPASSPITVTITKDCSYKTGTTIASPGFCYFTADVTHSDPNVDPYHHLDYSWNFGDSGVSGTGTWPYGKGLSKNTEKGVRPRAMHVFETNVSSTDFTVRVDVTDAAGNTNSDTDIVTIAGEDATWDAAATTCVSATGTYTGCIGSTTVNSNDFDLNLVQTAGSRTLFECNQTYLLDTTTSINLATAASNGSLIGGYLASGLNCGATPAIVTFTGNSNFFNERDIAGWRVRDIAFRFTATGTADDQNPKIFYYQAGGENLEVKDFLMLRTEAMGMGNCPNVSKLATTSTWNERVVFVDSQCEVVDNSSGGWPFGIYSFKTGGWMGYRFFMNDPSSAGACGFRTGAMTDIVLGHSKFEWEPGGGTTACPIDWRTCSTHAGCTSDQERLTFIDNEIWDNGSETIRALRFLATQDASTLPGAGLDYNDVIVDGNYFHFGTTYSRNLMSGVITLDGIIGATISNNICDLRGLSSASGDSVCVLQSRACSGADCKSDDQWYVYNNTTIEGGSDVAHNVIGASLHATDDAAFTDAYCINNLVIDVDGVLRSANDIDTCANDWTLESGNVEFETFGGITSSNCPFVGSSGTCNLSSNSETFSPQEFDIRTDTSTAADAVDNDGYDFSTTLSDDLGFVPRDFNEAARVNPDGSIGAFKD